LRVKRPYKSWGSRSMPLVNSDSICNSTQSFGNLAKRWLDWQCKMVAGIKMGHIFLCQDPKTKLFNTLAVWPQENAQNNDTSLHEIAQKTLELKDLYSSKINYTLGTESHVFDATGIPLRYGEKIIGIVVFLQTVYSQEHKKAVAPLLQWGVSWLESSIITAYEEKSQLTHLVTKLTQLALDDELIELTSHQVCNFLSGQLNCEKVSFSILEGLQMHTMALSNQLRFDHRSEYVAQIESCSEEAIDQKESIVFPVDEHHKHLITLKHQALSTAHHNMNIFTLVLSTANEPFAAFCLQRKKREPFSKEEIFILKKSAELLGPAIALKLKNEHSIVEHSKHLLTRISHALFGKAHLRFKLISLVFFLLLTLLSLIKTTSYIYADATLEGELQQVVIALDDGYVKSSYARAGDSVVKGQKLLTLKDEDLRLERDILVSEASKLNKEYQEELANAQRAKISILRAQIAQVQAKVKRIEHKIEDSIFKAPFSGIVISGDFSQAIGKPIKKGEKLFEVSLADNYRLILDVNEYDVAQLQLNQKGDLRLIGLPYETFEVTIRRITPIASIKDGGNYFHVEADVNEHDAKKLKPGMQGVVKIDVQEASVLWVWTHALFDRLRLWFWSIGL